ncbi:MAG: DUF4381 domain-containing protein [Gammaproteobacteria bacterium]|nr:DUF4381 domain-containing protein [Gammaproteobacteria bacterium]
MENQLPLRDIHLPDAITWWPPAPGWWLLLVLTLLLLGLVYLSYKRLRQPLLNKSAREGLTAITGRYRQHADKQLLLQDLSSLLRRIGISYLGRHQAAGLTGDSWYRQLNQLAADHGFSPAQIALLSRAPYQASPELSDQDIEALIQQSRHWLAALPRRRLADV